MTHYCFIISSGVCDLYWQQQTANIDFGTWKRDDADTKKTENGAVTLREVGSVLKKLESDGL